MARISGVNIPTNKKVSVGLTYIHGIGDKSALDICEKAGIDKDKRVNELLETEVIQIREIIDGSYRVEGELRRDISTNIKRLMDLGTNRGIRHRRKLPTRGQRTKTNARTRKGPKKPMRG